MRTTSVTATGPVKAGATAGAPTGPRPRPMPTRIVLVDDHAIMRQGLRAVLEREADLHVVGEAGSPAEAVAAVAASRPHVVLLDLKLTVPKGLGGNGAVGTNPEQLFAAGYSACFIGAMKHVAMLQKIALPVTIGSVRYPGIKIHDTRIIRLLEVLLHGGNTVGGWTAKQIHEAVVTTFQLPPKTYGLNQLRYDLRKLKGHGLLQRDGRRYAYRLTTKGVDVALLFLFFHKRLCGPLANSRFHHKPDPAHSPNSKLEAAYHKADKAIENIVNLLNAA